MDNATLNYWPLVVVLEDVYVPELAPAVIETIQDVNTETVSRMLAVVRIQALYDARKRTN